MRTIVDAARDTGYPFHEETVIFNVTDVWGYTDSLLNEDEGAQVMQVSDSGHISVPESLRKVSEEFYELMNGRSRPPFDHLALYADFKVLTDNEDDLQMVIILDRVPDTLIWEAKLVTWDGDRHRDLLMFENHIRIMEWDENGYLSRYAHTTAPRAALHALYNEGFTIIPTRDAPDAVSGVLISSLAFLHTKPDIILFDPEKELPRNARRAHEREHGTPLSPEFVVTIRPKARIEIRRGKKRLSLQPRRAHMVRGYFKTYDAHPFIPDGTYYIPPHARGSKGADSVAAAAYSIRL